MNEIENRIRALRGGEVPPPSPIESLRHRVSRRRIRRVAGTATLVALAALVTAGTATWWPNGDDGGRVETIDQPTDTSSLPSPSSSTTTGTSAATDTTGVEPPLASPPPVPVVLASDDGVVVVSGDDTVTVSGTPASSAYGIGTELVVFQDASTVENVFPPRAAGPVRAWARGEVRDLPSDPAATRVTLLDAAVVGGVPVALVAERFGEVGPDDTFEELVRIDLRDDSRTTLVRRPAWESGHQAARLLPDGDVVGLVSASVQLLLARWSPGATDPGWSVEVGFDTHVDLVVRDGDISVVHPTFDRETSESVLTVTRHDPDTGRPAPPQAFVVREPEDLILTGLFCREWLGDAVLACALSGGAPLAVSLRDESFTQLPGVPGALVTVVRAS